MSYIVAAVALLLLVSVGLFIKVVFVDKRPQKLGLLFIVLAVPLYLIYYDDRIRELIPRFQMRSWAAPLLDRYSATAEFDLYFSSDITPALMVVGILLVHLTVFQRVAVRKRLQRVHNPIATFLAGSVAATMVGGTIVSTFHWGWQGAVGIAVGFALVYLGAFAVLAAIVELIAAVARLFGVWFKRKLFAIATFITRVASWISSLGGRLISRALLERIRVDTSAQEEAYRSEQSSLDRYLMDGYVRDRNRRNRVRNGYQPVTVEEMFPHMFPAAEPVAEPTPSPEPVPAAG